MIFDKIKELLGGSIAENLPDLGGITEQFGDLGGITEQLGTVGEEVSGIAEGGVADITDAATNAKDILP